MTSDSEAACYWPWHLTSTLYEPSPLTGPDDVCTQYTPHTHSIKGLTCFWLFTKTSPVTNGHILTVIQSFTLLGIPLCPAMYTAMSALPQPVHQNYAAKGEAGVNTLINLEHYISQVYQFMSNFFNIEKVFLKHFSCYFSQLSSGAQGWTEKLMQLQNLWGAQLHFHSIKDPKVENWENGLNAVDIIYLICTSCPPISMMAICVASFGGISCTSRLCLQTP